MAVSAATILDECNTAIIGLLQNKTAEYWVAGRKVVYHDIDDLRKLRNDLRWEAAEESGSCPMFTLAQVDPIGGSV